MPSHDGLAHWRWNRSPRSNGESRLRNLDSEHSGPGPRRQRQSGSWGLEICFAGRPTPTFTRTPTRTQTHGQTSDCCVTHDTPGCDDSACQECVCAATSRTAAPTPGQFLHAGGEQRVCPPVWLWWSDGHADSHSHPASTRTVTPRRAGHTRRPRRGHSRRRRLGRNTSTPTRPRHGRKRDPHGEPVRPPGRWSSPTTWRPDRGTGRRRVSGTRWSTRRTIRSCAWVVRLPDTPQRHQPRPCHAARAGRQREMRTCLPATAATSVVVRRSMGTALHRRPVQPTPSRRPRTRGLSNRPTAVRWCRPRSTCASNRSHSLPVDLVGDRRQLTTNTCKVY